MTAAFLDRCAEAAQANLRLAYRSTALAAETWVRAVDDAEANDIERWRWRAQVFKQVREHVKLQRRVVLFTQYANERHERERRAALGRVAR